MKVKQKTTSLKREQAYQCVRDAITFGKLKPGEKVHEKSVGETFHLGRTPLREALRQLEMEGFIDALPNRGAFVRKISVDDVEHVYDVLAVLEGFAVENATLSANPSMIKELKDIEKKLIKDAKHKNFRKWLDDNARFHELFQRVTGNTVLSESVSNLRRRTYRYRALVLSIPGHIEEYLSDHGKVLDAVIEGKAERAGKAMRRHVRRAGVILATFLRDNPWV
jgi:DNA-binding GntR family transcriptional regulator